MKVGNNQPYRIAGMFDRVNVWRIKSSWQKEWIDFSHKDTIYIFYLQVWHETQTFYRIRQTFPLSNIPAIWYYMHLYPSNAQLKSMCTYIYIPSSLSKRIGNWDDPELGSINDNSAPTSVTCKIPWQ